MRYLLLILCLLFVLATGSLAQLAKISLEGKPGFDLQIEISGLAYYDGVFYLLKEKCNGLMRVSMNAAGTRVNSVLREIPLQFPGAVATGLEGLALCKIKGKAFFLITDEEQGNPKIRLYNIHTGIPAGVNIKRNPLDSCYGKFGVEGIAYDPDSAITYVLQERNREYQSKIYRFTTEVEGDSLLLTPKDTITIQHPVRPDGKIPEEGWRYSDIGFSAATKLLYCLKSYCVSSDCSGNNKYYIDTINTMEITGNTTLDFTHYGRQGEKISDFVNSQRQVSINHTTVQFSTNLEGITLEGDKLYFVSDTQNSNACQVPLRGQQVPARRKTLFLSKQLANGRL